MAKQAGLHKLNGKHDGMSYYRSQNGGYLVRSINTGMSQRVKEDEAFINTRRNAAEFGGAAKMAGAMVKLVSQRWRYILNSIATGDLAAKILLGMQQNTTAIWGRRNLPTTQFAAVRAAYNAESKNQFPDDIKAKLTPVVNLTTRTVSFSHGEEITVTSADIEYYNSLGADGIEVETYLMSVAVPTYDSALGKFVIDSSKNTLNPIEIGSYSVPLQLDDTILLSEAVYPLIPISYPLDAEGVMGGLLCVIKPVKVINGQNYVLQEHCAAHWVAITEAE